MTCKFRVRVSLLLLLCAEHYAELCIVKAYGYWRPNNFIFQYHLAVYLPQLIRQLRYLFDHPDEFVIQVLLYRG